MPPWPRTSHHRRSQYPSDRGSGPVWVWRSVRGQVSGRIRSRVGVPLYTYTRARARSMENKALLDPQSVQIGVFSLVCHRKSGHFLIKPILALKRPKRACVVVLARVLGIIVFNIRSLPFDPFWTHIWTPLFSVDNIYCSIPFLSALCYHSLLLRINILSPIIYYMPVQVVVHNTILHLRARIPLYSVPCTVHAMYHYPLVP